MKDTQIKHIYQLAESLRKQLELTNNAFERLKDVIDHEESLLPIEDETTF